MEELKSQVESILFVAARPIAVKRLAEACGAERPQVDEAIEALCAEYNREGRGVRILRNGSEVQMATAPDTARVVQEFLKDETTGEMTKPSLEALTVIAYRGPISKAELEQIRGVNCSLILRNLLMRGLIEASGERQDAATTYRVTMDFLRFLGLSSVDELPDYEKLHSHENVVRVLQMNAVEPTSDAATPEGESVEAEDGGDESAADADADEN